MRVTIGLPCYKVERTLPAALRSIFAQTYRDWELIIVDDGSPDRTLLIARAVRDPRVRVLADGQNRGLSARLNQIAAEASGELLARMDADDLMHPERLARQVALLNGNQDVDIVGSAVYSIDEQNKPVGMRGREPLNIDPRHVLAGEVWVHPTLMGRTVWFRDNPYDEAYLRAEDRELWLRTFRTSRFARLAEPLLFYREPLHASTLGNYLASCRTVRRIFRQYGPNICGWSHTGMLIAQSHMKGMIYRAFHALGWQGSLVRRRNGSITDAERCQAAALIAGILQTNVPGLQHDTPLSV